MPPQARKWQERLDREFPDGVVITSPLVVKHAFAVARPLVTAMHGIVPVVMFELHGHGGRTLVFEVHGWDEVQTRPCRLVRVVTGLGEGPDETVLLSGNVSPALAADMRAERTASLKLSEDGQAWQGSSWELA